MSKKNEIVIEPFLMAVLSSRLDSIGREMTNTLVRSSRSGVMNVSRDLSTAICDANGDVLMFPPSLPVHVGNMSLIGRSLLDFHGNDLHPGDAYLNNSPYHGNTHMADHTIIVPVFYEDELMFITACRGHQADDGNSIPTTYHATAKDIYEEGALCFPCVQVQRNYKDIDDIIRMAKVRIRCSDVWYGDYLAEVGGGRIGERRLRELCDKYGKDTLKAFSKQWQQYGRNRMTTEISKLPAGTWYQESTHDQIPGILDKPVIVRLKMTIDPKEGYIILDFSDSTDVVPCGLNLCEATTTSAARAGVLNRLPADIPHNEGAMGRIIVKSREGSSVGKAVHPFSSSVATTNVADRVTLAVQCAFNQVNDKFSMAEGGQIQPAAYSVISGYDWRFGDAPYINQLIGGATGGMGVKGHDGWVTYQTCTGGMIWWNPAEAIEGRYPIMYLKEEVVPDSGGAGEFDGAPACRVALAARERPVTCVYVCDGKYNPPRGVLGGQDGSPAEAAKFKVAEGEDRKEELPMFTSVDIQPGEALYSVCSSGGGCGDPLNRDPESVRHRVREGWVSIKKARDVYGVLLNTEVELYAVDYKATDELRKKMRKQRQNKEKGREHE